MSFKLRTKGKSREQRSREKVELWVRFNVPHGRVLFSPGALQAMGVGFGDRIEVLIGEGEDAGWIAFRREREGHGYILSVQRTADLFPLMRDLGLRGQGYDFVGEVRGELLIVEVAAGVTVGGGDE